MLGKRGGSTHRLLIAVGVLAASIVLPASAMGQGPGSSCASKIPVGLPAEQSAVLTAAAQKTDATPLPTGATLVDCNVAAGSIKVPDGVTVTPAPVVTSGSRAAIRQSGSGNVGTIGCGMTGHVYYVSSPTYIHQDVSWSCNAFYASMSGSGHIDTPSSGSSIKLFRQTSRTSGGTAALEHSGIAWYGYHNRAGWENATFAFTGVGFLTVNTTLAFV